MYLYNVFVISTSLHFDDLWQRTAHLCTHMYSCQELSQVNYATWASECGFVNPFFLKAMKIST